MQFSNAPLSQQALLGARTSSLAVEVAARALGAPSQAITHASQVHNPAVWSYSPDAQSTKAISNVVGLADGLVHAGRFAGAVGFFAEPIAGAITGYSEAAHLSRAERATATFMGGLEKLDNAVAGAFGGAAGGIAGDSIGSLTGGVGALPGAVAGGVAGSIGVSELYEDSFLEGFYDDFVAWSEPHVAAAVPYGLAAYDWAGAQITTAVGWADDIGAQLSAWRGD